MSTNSPIRSSTDWFALYTNSRREKHVARLLTERKIESFVPLYKVDRHWKKRLPVTLELPLFPNYVFVRAGQKGSLLSVPGVVSIIGNGNEPWPLEDSEIQAFRAALDVCKLQPHTLLAVGEHVRIKTGPLAGMKGVLLRKKSGLRVVITIEAISSSVVAELDETALESLTTNDYHVLQANSGDGAPLSEASRAAISEQKVITAVRPSVSDAIAALPPSTYEMRRLDRSPQHTRARKLNPR